MNEIGPQRQTIRMAKANRRAFYLVLLVFVFGYAAIFYVNSLAPVQSVLGLLILIALYSAACASVLIPTAPRSWIIDEHGVTDCSIFGRVLWKWDDFKSGRVQRAGEIAFYDRTKPRYRRFLNFFRAEKSEVSPLSERIAAMIPPRQLLELPELLVIPLDRWSHMILTSQKIMFEYQDGRKPHSVTWQNLTLAVFEDFIEEYQSYRRAILFFPDHEIEIDSRTPKPRNPRVFGEKAETLLEFIRKYCPADRVIIANKSQEVIDHPTYAAYTIKKQRRELIFVRLLFGLCILIFVGAAIHAYFSGTAKDPKAFYSIVGVMIFGLVCLLSFMERQFRIKVRSYKKGLEASPDNVDRLANSIKTK